MDTAIITAITTPHPVVFRAERLSVDRDYPLSVAPEDCARVFAAVLSPEDKERLEREHAVVVSVRMGAASFGRLFATSRDGALSALLTA